MTEDINRIKVVLAEKKENQQMACKSNRER